MEQNYSLTHAILDILVDSLGQIHLFDSPYRRMRRSFNKIKGIPEPPRWRYNKAMKYLERRGSIKIAKRGDKIFIELTRKGEIETFLRKIRNDLYRWPVWDGKWRLIIWDIPETSRLQRNRIRLFLKNLGFHSLQQSVFISPYPLPVEAVNYLKESGLLEYLRILRVDKLDEEKELLDRFSLTAKS